MTAKRRTTTKATPRTWLIRAGIGIAAGIAVGFAIGALAVRMLQPPGAIPVDNAAADSTHKPRGQSAAVNEPAADSQVDKPKNGIVVPQLIGLEEGDARQLILRAGFSVGSVTFKAGPPPMGTVITSFPVPGEAVALPAAVNLILSDGKGKADSAAAPPPSDDNSSEIPNAS